MDVICDMLLSYNQPQRWLVDVPCPSPTWEHKRRHYGIRWAAI